MRKFSILIVALVLPCLAKAEGFRCLKLSWTSGKQMGKEFFISHDYRTPEDLEKRIAKIKVDYRNPTVDVLTDVSSHEDCLQKIRDGVKAGKGLIIN